MFSLTLYREQTANCPTHRRRRSSTTVKTTMMFRNIANPRRTTLAHLEDADAAADPGAAGALVDLPAQTANPRRTILMEIPVTAAVQE